MAVSVLEAEPPRFSADEVVEVAERLFGVTGTASALGSERDQAFLIDDGDGGGGVLKISNSGEDPAILDLETEAIMHVAHVDPELPVARPLPASATGEYHAQERGHFVRCFERLRGEDHGPELGDDAVFAYAATHARLNLALRSFFHPAAGRYLLWDLKNAAGLRPLLASVVDDARRGLLQRALDRYEERVLPRWPRLGAQIVHGDFNLDNILFDEQSRISGIVDFGDTAHTAQAADFAIGVASLLRGRPEEELFRVARIAIDGYASRVPFEPDELGVLGDLVTARLVTIVAISAWRVARYPENAEYIQAWDDDSWKLLEIFDRVGADEVSYELGAARPAAATDELARRRRRILGPALTELTYDRPVHVVRGEGVWLFEADGARLLDAYNNVPVVGHCHPRVTEAVVRQTRLLNTHARYLYEPLIELGERLVGSMPPGSGLDTVMLVNSGSEANEVAWRLALAATGHRGAVVTDHAYHGVTTAIADLSPEEWPAGFRPEHVETVPPGSGIKAAVAQLDERGFGLAATFVDCGFTSDGIWTPDAAQLQTLVEQTHAAGGLFVADEVQAGHGRLGGHLWAFARYGLEPDVVTLGKPMGNGYPVAAVIARGDVFERFAESASLFSTFGGNPVAARAALAVLEVIDDEGLVAHAEQVGARLRSSLEAVRGLVEVRGSGLLVGVEVEGGSLAEAVVSRMRERGVLIGRTGRQGNVLKIRPPLPFGDEHAELLVAALSASLG
jgi:4-aminobutyrate aminotransferase-like enzyme/Ser/Thr protein kinase RdoA (MazF antagonist)